MSDLDLDPQLLTACAADLKDTCRLDGFEDKTQVMECLRKNEMKLSRGCRDVSTGGEASYIFEQNCDNAGIKINFWTLKE